MKTPLNHYLAEPLIKMGRWAVLPADNETWQTEHTSRYFQELFGLPKGTLSICTLEDGYLQAYVPLEYRRQLYRRIDELTSADPQGLDRILRTFYPLREKACHLVATAPTATDRLTNKELISLYRTNRDWVHRLSAYDQFGWITEQYWEPKMELVLTKKAGLTAGSPEYHRVLFALTKPEELSTTLRERRAVIAAALEIQRQRCPIGQAAVNLARDFGWMPVFIYGTPWDTNWYEKQIRSLLQKETVELEREYEALKNYSANRQKEVEKIGQTYGLNDADLQIFTDFGLVLDTRNEAEFFVSFAGAHLMPLYEEIARRLSISARELRMLFEDEIVAALEGKLDPKKVIEEKQGIVAWGFDPEMKQRFNIMGEDARRLFEGVEKNLQKSEATQKRNGLCASPGQATGCARIILSPADNDRVQSGDILVTVATTVDYLPAMQRAGAIVTEVGGLTCHAAVVAREFGIPCIVSYPQATTVFKDGQSLKLDADKATITIIKK